ncbi:hypothetical protein D3C86_1603380 [compost metagenome]
MRISGPPISKLWLYVTGFNNDLVRNSKTSVIAIGWHLVFSHFGVIMMGSLLTKSRMISNEALPEPTMIPALKVVVAKIPVFRIVSTAFLEDKCLESD